MRLIRNEHGFLNADRIDGVFLYDRTDEIVVEMSNGNRYTIAEFPEDRKKAEKVMETIRRFLSVGITTDGRLYRTQTLDLSEYK